MFEQLKLELDQTPPVTGAVELNMTSLLGFPPGLRQLLTWILRQKVVQAARVAEFIREDEQTAQTLMDLLSQKGLVEEEQGEEGVHYLVPVRSSRNYRVPERVWKALDE
jgi:hypothetical protein